MQSFEFGKVETVATARKPKTPSFERNTPQNYHAVKLEITDPSNIQSNFPTAPNKFLLVDVMVNNARYSRPFEELSDGQIRRQTRFDSFGLIKVTRTALTLANKGGTQRRRRR